MFTHADRSRLNYATRLLELINTKESIQMAREQELMDAVENETNAGVAMSMAWDKMAADFAELKAGLDPAAQAKIDEAVAKLNANRDVWVAKVMANTPAAPVDPAAPQEPTPPPA